MNKGTMILRNGDKTARFDWHPALVRIDAEDASKGLRHSETQIEINVKSSTIGSVTGKRTRYTGDMSKLAEVIKRYEKRGFEAQA